ncbi:hypothetical protein MKW94_004258, partial [Papaver nudicaule]|nr:hypothetical protein [Papaver nudicaule]
YNAVSAGPPRLVRFNDLAADIFELGFNLSLQDMGSSKMLLYLNMFIFSNIGGAVADHLITSRIMSVTRTRKFLNTVRFVAFLASMALPRFRTSDGAVFCSSVALDVAPRYAGIVMGISNTAGKLAGMVGVTLTGKLQKLLSWTSIFFIPGYYVRVKVS